MTEASQNPGETPTKDDWSLAQPEHTPQPSIWPAALALGATLLLWGLIVSIVVGVVGVVLFSWSLAGWIQDIRHERAKK